MKFLANRSKSILFPHLTPTNESLKLSNKFEPCLVKPRHEHPCRSHHHKYSSEDLHPQKVPILLRQYCPRHWPCCQPSHRKRQEHQPRPKANLPRRRDLCDQPRHQRDVSSRREAEKHSEGDDRCVSSTGNPKCEEEDTGGIADDDEGVVDTYFDGQDARDGTAEETMFVN
jgi:hypothetical protein